MYRTFSKCDDLKHQLFGHLNIHKSNMFPIVSERSRKSIAMTNSRLWYSMQAIQFCNSRLYTKMKFLIVTTSNCIHLATLISAKVYLFFSGVIVKHLKVCVRLSIPARGTRRCVFRLLVTHFRLIFCHHNRFCQITDKPFAFQNYVDRGHKWAKFEPFSCEGTCFHFFIHVHVRAN